MKELQDSNQQEKKDLLDKIQALEKLVQDAEILQKSQFEDF